MKHIHLQIRYIFISLILLGGYFFLFSWEAITYFDFAMDTLKDTNAQIADIVLSSQRPFLSLLIIIYSLCFIITLLSIFMILLNLNKKIQNQKLLLLKYKQAIKRHQKQNKARNHN
jgi:hypothetical protein